MKNKKKILSLLACLSLLTSCNKSTPSSSSCKTTTSTPTSTITPVDPTPYLLTRDVGDDQVQFEGFTSELTDEMKLRVFEFEFPEVFNDRKLTTISIEGNFKGFNNLKKIKISRNITKISFGTSDYIDRASSSFEYLPKLESIEVDENNTAYKVEGNCLIQTDNNTIICGWGDVVIPDDITTIRSNAFKNNESITSIKFGANVTTINNSYSIKRMKNLNKIEVDENNTAFKTEGNCLIQTSNNTIICGWGDVVIPSSIDELAYNSFTHCLSIKSIHVTKQVKNLGNNMAYGINDDRELKDYVKITCDSDSDFYFENNCLIQKIYNDDNELTDQVVLLAYPDENGTITIGGNITKINTMLSITSNNNKSAIKSIVFKEGFKRIQNEGLNGAPLTGLDNLTTIELPSTIEYIANNYIFGSSAFSGAYNIKTITLKEGNTNYRIEGNCLITYREIINDSSDITDQYYTPIFGWGDVVIPDDISYLDRACFGYNYSITSFTLNKNIKMKGLGFMYDASNETWTNFKEFNYKGTVDEIKKNKIYNNYTLLDTFDKSFGNYNINFLDDEGNITETHTINDLKNSSN